MPCISKNLPKYQPFVQTQLNETVLFLIIQFSVCHFFALSLNVKLIYLTHRYDSIRRYQSGSEWNWERWQWRFSPHSPKFLHYWSLTIRLFRAIFMTFVRWGFRPLSKSSRSILQPQHTGLQVYLRKLKYTYMLYNLVELTALSPFPVLAQSAGTVDNDACSSAEV